MCDLLTQYNKEFQIPKYTPAATEVTAEQLISTVDPNPKKLHPVSVCQLNCAAIAKAKHEECKTKVKMFTEYMKNNGCPGTWCSTKKKSPCARRKPAAKKTAAKKKAVARKR